MTDFPEMTIATDRVDDEMVDHPRRWNIVAIRKFMFTFGLVSSVFDFITFGALLLILHATQDQFRTGWFLESVNSAAYAMNELVRPASVIFSQAGERGDCVDRRRQ